jgi:hypothetical protein
LDLRLAVLVRVPFEQQGSQPAGMGEVVLGWFSTV